MGWTYQLRYVRCGKPRCRCAGGRGHGPYWYAFRYRGGRMFSRYVGKLKFGTVDDTPQAPEPRVSPRWVFDGRMRLDVALRILAFAKIPTRDELRVRYRTLLHQHQPDHGGDTQIAAGW